MGDFNLQPSFNAGELAPSLFGRVDYNKFSIGAGTMRNFFVSYRGGAYSRAGTEFVGYSKQTQNQYATGYIEFSVNPSPGDTITLGGTVWTFVASGAVGNEINIAANLGGTLSFARVTLNASSDPSTSLCTYANDNPRLSITYKTPGPGGQSFTLAASAATPSGAHLTGGANKAPRLVTFQFSLEQGLLLEFGHEYMRVVIGGAYVTETPVAITAATQTSPCVVEATIPGLVDGDWIAFQDVEGMIELNGQSFVAGSVGGGFISLLDIYGNPVDATVFGAYTGGGTVGKIYELETPYSDDDLAFLKYTQSADVMTLTLRNQISGVEYPSYDLSRLADDDWTLVELDTGSSIAAPASATGIASTTGLVNYNYAGTAVDRETGDESVMSPIADIVDANDISSTAGSNTIQLAKVDGAGYYNFYRAPVAYDTLVPAGALFGYLGTSYGTEFVDSNIIPDMSLVPPLHKNPFAPGQLLGVTITSEGSSLADVDYVINTSTGSGAVGYPVIVGGKMTAFVFTNGGEGYEPTDTITFDDPTGTKAEGDIVFAVNPSPGDTITLNGVVWTFVAGPPGPYETFIAGSLGATLNFLVLAPGPAENLNSSTDPLLTVATYTRVGGDTLHIEYKTNGTAGNAYTLAASAATPSGPTLTGGTGGIAPTGTLVVGPESGTYPSVASYFQQRRVYANSANQPDTYWMSQPGAFKNFDSRVPTIDSDAITGSPWSLQVDGIQWLIPMSGALVTLTGSTAFQLLGSGGSAQNPVAITPSSQQAQPQVFNGAHFRVAPVRIDYDIYYLQAKGSVIRSLSYNFWLNVFTGVDVTFLSSHLFTGFNIEAMAWCEEPFKVMWVVRDDGILLSLTSLKSQEVMGWARHDTQGLFLAAAAVTEPPVDALYVCTQRFMPDGNAPFIIERMNDRLWETIEDSWCVDCGLKLAQPTPNARLTVDTATGLGQPIGYDDLVGGSGYSQTATVTVEDPTGTGCIVTPSIVNGEIVSLVMVGGTGYTKPVFVVTDEAAHGSGFSATVVLDNLATFTASGAIFSADNEGDIIRCGGGVAEITNYISPTEVEAQICVPIVALIPNTDTVRPFDAGDWTLTTPVDHISSLQHLAGMEVVGVIDGTVFSGTVSSTGTVDLPFNASSIILGLGYGCQLQSLYVDGGQQTQQGRRKQMPAFTVRLEQSANIEAGTNQVDGSTLNPMQVDVAWVSMAPAREGQGIGDPPYGYATITGTTYRRVPPLYTGDIRIPVTSGFAKPGQAAVQQTDPLPVNVLAFIRELDVGDEPEDDSRAARGGK